jgi:DNA-nicking Smr family endonuclease
VSRRRRTLRPDEEDLWQSVARTAQPLHPDRPTPAPLDLPAALSKPRPKSAPEQRIEPFHIGAAATRTNTSHDLVPDLSTRLAQAPLRMDARAFSRMSRGKLTPEARIDLHGLTLAEARPELVRFILNAQADGLRLVLVITGKGRPSDDDGPIPRRHGALRHQVPVWLAQAPLRQAILQVAEAHLKHGGSGAFYVYLGRNRA